MRNNNSQAHTEPVTAMCLASFLPNSVICHITICPTYAAARYLSYPEKS